MEKGISAYKKIVSYKKVRSLLGARFVSLGATLESGVEGKKGFLKNNRWRFNKKAKGLIVFAIIAVMLVSVFAFLPKGTNSTPNPPQSSDSPTASPSAIPHETNSPPIRTDPIEQITSVISNWGGAIVEAVAPKDPGVIESAEKMSSTVWRAVAANAWRYFQPGIGVDPNTGLPRGGATDAPNFTDWDLGVYIQAVIDAQKIGVVSTDGDWGSSARLETIVKFLENRTLNSHNYPFWFYQAKDGESYRENSDYAKTPVDGADTGRLFVALNNLRVYNTSLASRINTIVIGPGNRSNYAVLVPSVLEDSYSSNNIYAYFIASGFAGFWPNELAGAPNRILNNILSSGSVSTYGVSLPNAPILGDPLLSSVFDLNNNSSQLMTITRQFYLAHEAYYNATGQYRAFGEGGTLSDHWAYEWVVLPENRTWVILDENHSAYNISPIIYAKISLSFLAIYNTPFARNMSVYLEQTLPDPGSGYSEGIDESGAQLLGVGDQTNGLILSAAYYAVRHYP